MKLAAIYNCWDGVELLRHSMLSVKSRVDLYIIVFQNVSNYGEHYAPLSDMDLSGFNYVLKFYTPEIGFGMHNEIKKRNIGLDIARDSGCSHFLHMDCDEIHPAFSAATDAYLASGKDGSVLKMYTYFKHPTLRFENPDTYFVPFIHKLQHNTRAGRCSYPYYVDPTREINTSGVVLLPQFMHHFSYVRKDIGRKIRNSSAKNNMERSKILQDYENAVPGYYVEDFFRQKLVEVENQFGIEI